MTQEHLAGLPASGRLRDALDGLEQGVGEHGQTADGRDRVCEGSCSDTVSIGTWPDAAVSQASPKMHAAGCRARLCKQHHVIGSTHAAYDIALAAGSPTSRRHGTYWICKRIMQTKQNVIGRLVWDTPLPSRRVGCAADPNHHALLQRLDPALGHTGRRRTNEAGYAADDPAAAARAVLDVGLRRVSVVVHILDGVQMYN